jgi:hypothetical protein
MPNRFNSAPALTFSKTDHDNCRVYYSGGEGGVYAFQEASGQRVTCYRCSRDGEPDYPIDAGRLAKWTALDGLPTDGSSTSERFLAWLASTTIRAV